jgi:hypothetical protein
MKTQDPGTLSPNLVGDEREAALELIIQYALELSEQRQIPGAITPQQAAIRNLRHNAIRFNVLPDPLASAREAVEAVHKARVAYERAVEDEQAARLTLKAYESGE